MHSFVVAMSVWPMVSGSVWAYATPDAVYYRFLHRNYYRTPNRPMVMRLAVGEGLAMDYVWSDCHDCLSYDVG